MRAVILILIGLGLAWAYPKLKKQYQAHKTPLIVDTVQKVDEPHKNEICCDPIKPSGPGDAWLPRVKQLEKQLEQFRTQNPNHKSQN